jgi:hypothetical protein
MMRSDYLLSFVLLLLVLSVLLLLMCILACLRKLLTTENRRPQSLNSHAYGFYCFVDEYICRHYHIYILTSPVWLCICVANELGLVNLLGQTEHLYLLGATDGYALSEYESDSDDVFESTL